MGGEDSSVGTALAIEAEGPECHSLEARYAYL